MWRLILGQKMKISGVYPVAFLGRPRVKNLKYLVGKASFLDENHIYGSLEQQVQIVNIFSDILEERELKKNENYNEDNPQLEGPVHPAHHVGVLQHSSYL